MSEAPFNDQYDGGDVAHQEFAQQHAISVFESSLKLSHLERVILGRVVEMPIGQAFTTADITETSAQEWNMSSRRSGFSTLTGKVRASQYAPSLTRYGTGRYVNHVYNGLIEGEPEVELGERRTPKRERGVNVTLLELPGGALCAETDPEAFFPEQGGSTAAAKAVCALCEVRLECLENALALNEEFGVFGGMTLRERRKLARSRQNTANPV